MGGNYKNYWWDLKDLGGWEYFGYLNGLKDLGDPEDLNDWSILGTQRTLRTGGPLGQEDLGDQRNLGTQWTLYIPWKTVSQGPSDLGYHVRIFDMRLGTQRTQWTSYLGDLRNLKTWRTLVTEEPWGPGDHGDQGTLGTGFHDVLIVEGIGSKYLETLAQFSYLQCQPKCFPKFLYLQKLLLTLYLTHRPRRIMKEVVWGRAGGLLLGRMRKLLSHADYHFKKE